MNVFECIDPDNVATDGSEHKYFGSNVYFISCYKFGGSIDIHVMEESFYSVVDAVVRSGYRLVRVSHDKYEWRKTSRHKDRVLVIETQDIDGEIEQFIQTPNVFSIVASRNDAPMILSLIHCGQKRQCYVSTITNHLFMGGYSSQAILGLIFDYYNASMSGDSTRLTSIIDTAKQIRTVHCHSILADAFSSSPTVSHEANVHTLRTLKTYDAGGYTLQSEQVRSCMDARDNGEISGKAQYIDARNTFGSCRINQPDITRNSIVCAALVKALYILNTTQKHIPADHKISFLIASSLLSREMANRYCGNYVGGFPLTVDGQQSLEELATTIHKTVAAYNTCKMDATVAALERPTTRFHSLSENEYAQAIRFHNTMSFIVTNWTNHRFVTNTHLLNGCHPIDHKNAVAVRIDPRKDSSVRMNKLCFIFNLCPNDRLSLRTVYASKDAERSIANAVKSVFSPADDCPA